MYCVYMTVYFGELLPRRYIGSSSVKRVLSGYNGSVSSKKYSAAFKLEQNTNKHLFKTRILSYHETSISAREEELRLQMKYEVVKNAKYMNESLARPNGFHGRDVSGENNPMFGKSRKGEIHNNGENVSAALKKSYANGSLDHMKIATSERMKENNPSKNPEIMDKIKDTWKASGRGVGEKNGMFGKVGRLSGKRLYNNGSETKAFVEGQQPDGWVIGRANKKKISSESIT